MEADALLVAAEKLTLAAIMQRYVAVEDDCKLLTLGDPYDSVSISQSVIFCNTRETVTRLAKKLNAMHHAVSHLAKGDREKIMATFKAGTTRVLITTDVLARGIDVQHVNVVINYDILRTWKTISTLSVGPGGGVARPFLKQKPQT